VVEIGCNYASAVGNHGVTYVIHECEPVTTFNQGNAVSHQGAHRSHVNHACVGGHCQHYVLHAVPKNEKSHPL
jgi:hypothetical protein